MSGGTRHSRQKGKKQKTAKNKSEMKNKKRESKRKKGEKKERVAIGREKTKRIKGYFCNPLRELPYIRRQESRSKFTKSSD